MKKVRFEIAGKPRSDNNRVFFQSNNRKYEINTTIYHRNDYHTIIEINKNIFKEHFKFNFLIWIYETDLKWKELKKMADITIIKLI